MSKQQFIYVLYRNTILLIIKKLLLSLAVFSVLALLVSEPSEAKGIRFNKTQIDHLKFACKYGKQHPYKGQDMCYTYAAIIWQENKGDVK